MESGIQFIGDWGHALGAAVFAALAIWTTRRLTSGRFEKLLVAALSLTSIWSLAIAFGDFGPLEMGLMESLRNCGWLACLSLFPTQAEISRLRGTGPLYAVLALLLPAQVALDIAWMVAPEGEAISLSVENGQIFLRLLWALGALILTQRVYMTCHDRERAGIAPLAAAIAAMWGYDLLLYTSALLPDVSTTFVLFSLRGVVMAIFAPIIVLTLRSQKGRPVQASRVLQWHGVRALAGIVGVSTMLTLLWLVDSIASPVIRVIVTALLFAAAAGAMLVIPSTRLSALLKLWVTKHLFRHRYDYREQWMAFIDTIHGADSNDVSLYDRLLKAVADITSSSGASLLMLDEEERFACHGQWNWKGEEPQVFAGDPALLELMRSRAWVADIGQMRLEKDAGLPEWLRIDADAWAMVPLLHFGDLLGVILLSRPPLARPLDWEDFDMLRAAGRQVASYIAEARGQQALEEARRFDEFNRRFAFIMHDIKNLVSQIALVARNAQRHADNPAFRQDMILTLTECTDKMNALLARLSRHTVRGEADRALFALGDAIRAAIAPKRKGHPLVIEGDLSTAVETDRAAVEQIIAHLVQNAIDASNGDAPVVIRVQQDTDAARVAVIDHGCGMSAEFLRDHLYRPFASTKQGGFGIGTFEARELAQAMGGHLKAESVEGKGSIFTLHLPLALRSAAKLSHKGRAA